MNVFYTVLSSLFLAAITGLTFVAYKHPKGFQRLYWLILIPLMLVNVALLSWNIAINRVLNAIKSDLSKDIFIIASKHAHEIDAPQWFQFFVFFISVYFVFLLFLPNIIDD